MASQGRAVRCCAVLCSATLVQCGAYSTVMQWQQQFQDRLVAAGGAVQRSASPSGGHGCMCKSAKAPVYGKHPA